MSFALEGKRIEVDYKTEGDGSGPSYSPMYGADSGDPLVIQVVEVRNAETNEVVEVSDDAEEKISAYICEHHEFDYDSWELDI